MKEKTIKTSVLIPISLHGTLKKAACRNNRTLTKEVTKRLIDSEKAGQAEDDLPRLGPK